MKPRLILHILFRSYPEIYVYRVNELATKTGFFSSCLPISKGFCDRLVIERNDKVLLGELVKHKSCQTTGNLSLRPFISSACLMGRIMVSQENCLQLCHRPSMQMQNQFISVCASMVFSRVLKLIFAVAFPDCQ